MAQTLFNDPRFPVVKHTPPRCFPFDPTCKGPAKQQQSLDAVWAGPPELVHLVCPICHCKVMDFIAVADPDHVHATYRKRLSQSQFTKNRYPQEMWQAHVVRGDSTAFALDQK